MENMDKSDQELVEYLQQCPLEVVYGLTQILGDRLGFNGLKTSFGSESDISAGKDEREALARTLVEELGYFGSHNLAYWTRWILRRSKTVGYHEILYDVATVLNRQMKSKTKIPRVASVADRESMICGQLLNIAFKGKTEKEIARMVSEAGLEADAKKIASIKSAVQGGAGGAVIGLVKVLGKKTVTEFIKTVVTKIITAKIGKEAAEKVVKKLLAKVSQKTVAAFTAFVGWALLAKDVIDLGSAATRVTIPAVALIASARTTEALQSSDITA